MAVYKASQALLSLVPKSCSISSWTNAAPSLIRAKLGQQGTNRIFVRTFTWQKHLKQDCISKPRKGNLFKSSWIGGNSCNFSVNCVSYARARYISFADMIVYSRITPSDHSAVTDHMLKGFYKYEPFGLALGLTMDQVESWFPKFIEEVFNYYEPVSFMAKDSETGEVVGAIINIVVEEKRRTPPSMKPYLVREKQPVKWQIVQFLEDLEEGVDPVGALKMDASKENKILCCLFVSVFPEYGGQGIAKTLIRESEDDAKKHLPGVTIGMTDVTSQFSYLAFQKLGYTCIKEVKYLTYKDPDGIPIFEGREKQLGAHTHARVMVKKL